MGVVLVCVINTKVCLCYLQFIAMSIAVVFVKFQKYTAHRLHTSVCFWRLGQLDQAVAGG